MLRFAFISLLAAALGASAQPVNQAGTLNGRVEGNTYISPTGGFKIKIPVLPGLGGTISDTPNVVTFEDDYSTHISIAAWPQDTSERWKLSIHGAKDYLGGFFMEYVLADFKKAFQGVQVDNNALFMKNLFDGALLTYVELPGGSMFATHVTLLDPEDKLPAAKRGNLIFVQNGFVYVVSTELAERVTEGTAYTLTTEQENALLLDRIEDIVHKMEFPPPPRPALP